MVSHCGPAHLAFCLKIFNRYLSPFRNSFWDIVISLTYLLSPFLLLDFVMLFYYVDPFMNFQIVCGYKSFVTLVATERFDFCMFVDFMTF